jgi:hypothetical protein
MNPEKNIIARAVRRCALKSRPGWSDVAAAVGDAEISSIEADCSTITTVDRLFDGQATIHLTDSRRLHATVFGRFDARRAEIDRVVVETPDQQHIPVRIKQGTEPSTSDLETCESDRGKPARGTAPASRQIRSDQTVSGPNTGHPTRTHGTN